MVVPTADAPMLADIGPEEVSEIEALVRQGLKTRSVPFVGWAYGSQRLTANITGQLSFTRDTNPDSIGYDVYNMMRGYSTIKAALFLLKAPVMGMVKNATVVCEDPKVKATVEAALIESDFLFRLFKSSLQALHFGVSFNEIEYRVEEMFVETLVRDEETGAENVEVAWDGPIITMRLHEVNPSTVTRIRRRSKPRDGKPGDGSYDGFIQQSPDKSFTNEDGMSEQGVLVEPLKSFIHTHDSEYGNLWGKPRTRDAYPYYFWANAVWKYWMLWGEKKAGPTRIARFPEGTTLFPGTSTPVDNSVIALQTIAAMDQVSTIALPSTVEPNSKVQKWDVEEMNVTDRSDTYEKMIGALDRAMLHAMFVPERSFQEAQTVGTNAEAQAHTETFMLTMDEEKDATMEDVNSFIVPRFVATNFGDVPCRIELPSLSDEKRAAVIQAFNILLTNPENQSMIDFRRIAEDQGLPLNELEDEEDLEDDELLDEEELDEDVEVDEEVVDPETGETDAGLPSNLVLFDLDESSLELWDFPVVSLVTLADVDLSKYTMTPDAKSILGYKIVNNITGKRVLGASARNVIKAFKSQGEKARKKAEVEARKAQRKAESERKKAETAAKSAARKAESEAKRGANKAASAAKKGETAARVAQNKAATEARKNATKAASAAKKAQSEAQRASKKGEADAKKAAAQAEREAKKAAAEAKRLEREAARTTKTEQRVAERQAKDEFKANKQVASEQQKQQSAATSAVKAERSALEKDIKDQDLTPAAAMDKIRKAGYTPAGTPEDKTSAIAAAEAAARKDPNSVFTLIKVGDQYIVAKKPKDAVTTRSKNVAASDVPEPQDEDLDDSLPGFDSSGPDEQTERLWQRAAERISGFFRRERSDDTDEGSEGS